MPLQGNIVAAVLIVVFGFFFATVSSRITGLIGSSSNPISGMTIATLILTCLLFVALGWTGDCYSPIALCVGAVVCIAAANAGNTSPGSQDRLHRRRHAALSADRPIIGVVVSALVDRADDALSAPGVGIGSPALPAPQATLMATIIKGLLSQNLPWGLVLVGVFISVTLELCGIHSLSFAVGSYLPIATTAPIFVGRPGALVGGASTRQWREESELGAGTLFSSGLIAGGSICGILYAVLVGTERIGPFQAIGNVVPWFHGETGLAKSRAGCCSGAGWLSRGRRKEDCVGGSRPGSGQVAELKSITFFVLRPRRRTRLGAAGDLVARRISRALIAYPPFYHLRPIVVVGTSNSRTTSSFD